MMHFLPIPGGTPDASKVLSEDERVKQLEDGIPVQNKNWRELMKFLLTIVEDQMAEKGLLTTKGDILTHTIDAIVRLGVGGQGQVLTVDSTTQEGIKWGTPVSTVFPLGLATFGSGNDGSVSFSTPGLMVMTAGENVKSYDTMEVVAGTTLTNDYADYGMVFYVKTKLTCNGSIRARGVRAPDPGAVTGNQPTPGRGGDQGGFLFLNAYEADGSGSIGGGWPGEDSPGSNAASLNAGSLGGSTLSDLSYLNHESYANQNGESSGTTGSPPTGYAGVAQPGFLSGAATLFLKTCRDFMRFLYPCSSFKALGAGAATDWRLSISGAGGSGGTGDENVGGGTGDGAGGPAGGSFYGKGGDGGVGALGAGNGMGSSAAGAGGAGCVTVVQICRFTSGSTLTISSKGGNGGNAGTPTGSGGGAGGAGGGGGGLLIAIVPRGSGTTLTVGGGTKGAKSGTGSVGNDGSTGLLHTLYFDPVAA